MVEALVCGLGDLTTSSGLRMLVSLATCGPTIVASLHTQPGQNSDECPIPLARLSIWLNFIVRRWQVSFLWQVRIGRDRIGELNHLGRPIATYPVAILTLYSGWHWCGCACGYLRVEDSRGPIYFKGQSLLSMSMTDALVIITLFNINRGNSS